MQLPEPIRNLRDKLAELPSIGPRQATRLAFYLVSQGKNAIDGFASAIGGLARVKTCSRCFFAHENPENLCGICADPKRDKSIIAIVEKETDLLSLESTKKFRGRYLILGEIPKTGMFAEWQKLRLQNLKRLIEKELRNPSSAAPGKAEEIILAFNPTSVGDWNASLIAKELAPFAKKISRLGRGLPTGGEIEFADDATLESALEQRK